MLTKEQKAWKVLSHVVMALMSAAALLPFILLIVASFTEERAALRNGYTFFPEQLSLEAYEYIMNNSSVFFRAYGMTVLVTLVGTAASLLVTALTGYALSKQDMPGAKFFNLVVIFTMLFNGGLVATYISYITIFNIKNTLAALLLPFLMMNAFMVMLTRNFFTHNIPGEIYESARIDGAGEFYIFYKLVLPLSVPILATVGLMTAISYWNDWQNSLYFVDDKAMYTIQAVLNSINEGIAALASLGGSGGLSAAELPTTTIRMAVAVIGILPILITYPFFQKYFAKGLTMGSVKG